MIFTYSTMQASNAIRLIPHPKYLFSFRFSIKHLKLAADTNTSAAVRIIKIIPLLMVRYPLFNDVSRNQF